VQQQESSSFLKKRTKKRFPLGAQSAEGGTYRTGKRFLVLFFKKARLAS
jgi:hypothetical protein